MPKTKQMITVYGILPKGGFGVCNFCKSKNTTQTKDLETIEDLRGDLALYHFKCSQCGKRFKQTFEWVGEDMERVS